jgi:hypothetical protein
MTLDAGGRGGGKVTPRKTKQSATKNPITRNLLGAIRSPQHKSNRGTSTTIKKSYRPTPDVRKSSGSRSTSTSSSYSTPSERRSVGTNGGRTSARDTTKKGAPNANRGNGGGRGGSKSGGGGPSRPGNDSLMKQARQYINRDIRAAVQQLANENQARRKDFRWDQAQADSRYDRAKGDLNHIFGEANEQNQLQTQAILDRITGQQGATNQMFDQLAQRQQGNTSQNTQALLGELQRLGIEGGANLAPMQADAAWAQNMAEQGRTNTLANLGAMGQSAGDIGNLISQMASSSNAANQGRQLNLKNQTIAESQNQYMGERDEIRDAMRQERLQRGNRIMDLYRELEEQSYNRWFTEREANRANRLGWSNFNHGVSMDNAGLMMDKAEMLAAQREQAALRRAQENALRNLSGGGGGSNTRYNPMSNAAQIAFPGLFGG